MSVAHGHNSSLAQKKSPSATSDGDQSPSATSDGDQPCLLPRVDPKLLTDLIGALRAAYNDAKDPFIQSKSDVELLEDMVEEFEELDLDHDGFISQEEFQNLRDGYDGLTKEEIMELMEADEDGDGVDFTEFATSKMKLEEDDYESTIDKDRLELLMKEFKTHDLDNDGSLSSAEYRQVKLTVNAETDGESNVTDMMELPDGLGDVDFATLVKVMQDGV